MRCKVLLTLVVLSCGLGLGAAAPAGAQDSLRGAIFVLDPGHGTRYPDGRPLNVGAVGPDGVQEAVVTLAVADDLAQRLRGAGAKVVLTRSYAQPYRVATDKSKDNRARAALGFVSNPVQERLLASASFQQREAQALFGALAATFAR